MKFYSLIPLLFLSCSNGNLIVIADVPNSLNEISAAETLHGSDLIWTIEDAGNKNELYGLNTKGQLIKNIKISNAKNEDWEDLTSDTLGNIYIGDFGNNNKKREQFTIYKVSHPNKSESFANAETIEFSLPKELKSKDFEAFFIYNNSFYIFSKEEKKSVLIKVPNTIGEHVAEIVGELKLKGKNNRITSADISDDGKNVVLLNHDKIWILNNYEADNFLNGTIHSKEFNHKSQKEGVCFKNDSTLIITDEFANGIGGNIYEFQLTIN